METDSKRSESESYKLESIEYTEDQDELFAHRAVEILTDAGILPPEDIEFLKEQLETEDERPMDSEEIIATVYGALIENGVEDPDILLKELGLLE